MLNLIFSSSLSAKYYIVHSNCNTSYASIVQMLGILDVLAVEDPLQHYKAFYMNSNIKKNTDASFKHMAQYAFKSIASFNPDYLVIIGDQAYKYIGIHYKDKKPIVLSEVHDIVQGLGEIQAKYDLTKFKEVISKTYAGLWKIKLLYDPSEDSRSILKEVRDETIRLQLTTSLQEIVSQKDLTKNLLAFNKDSRCILMSCITKIPANNGSIMTIRDVYRLIRSINIKHMEVGFYSFVSKPDIGFAMGVGPNYYEMGKLIGKKLLNYKPEPEIVKTTLSVNIQRMNELGLVEVYKKSSRKFDSIHSYHD